MLASVADFSNPDMPLRYISTRGQAPALGFSDAMLASLARDGGLYVPEIWPVLAQGSIAGFAGKPYAEVAQAVMTPFTNGDIASGDLSAMLHSAYATFRHSAVTPLVQLHDNLFVLELFHGSTLAFKDVAMQVLARMMDHELKRRNQRATIVAATSGDTGAAAVGAFAGLEQVDLFILYPAGRVSEVQRRQMTTVDAPNVHAIALDGTFDDCQNLLKGLFNHHAFADEIGLSGVNSINWARVMAQATYYFTSAVALGSPARPVSFTVPTGNFGDVLAGYMAKRMGLPVQRLVIATNANDILARALGNGTYDLRQVEATQSPSMDIQVSSNFERLLFEALGRDASEVCRLMANLRQSRRFDIPAAALAAIHATFDAGSTSEAATTEEIARTYRETGYVLDPHTAVGVSVARREVLKNPAVPMVVLGTAHPAKFPDAVEKAIGLRPKLPAHLAGLLAHRERFTPLPNDQGEIEKFIRRHGRSGRARA